MIDVFLKGGPIMYPLLICSIIALTVIIERIIFWIVEDHRSDQALVNDVLSLAEKGNWEDARKRIGDSKDSIIMPIFFRQTASFKRTKKLGTPRSPSYLTTSYSKIR